MKKTYLGRVGVAAIAILAASVSHGANASTIFTGTYNDAGSSSNYTNASSIPVSTTGDIIFGLQPTNTNYVGTFEATGGTAAPLTDGKTSTDGSVSQPTNNQNAIFDLGNGDVFFDYTLPTTPSGLGYDISSVVVTTGHQDYRVNQAYDILVATVNNPSLTSLSNFAGFTYTPSSGNGGAAQTTISDSTGLLASGVTQIRFVVQDNGTDVYRELGVFGSATAPSAVPEPAQTVTLAMGVLTIAALAFKARRKNYSA